MEIENISDLGPSASLEWLGGFGTFAISGTLDGFVGRLEHQPTGAGRFIESLPRNPDRNLQDGRESILVNLPAGRVRVRVLKAGGDTDVTLTATVAQKNQVVGDGVDNLVVLTQAQYDALDPADPRTAYLIKA